MGLFNFIKNAGRVLGIGGHNDAVQDESHAAPSAAPAAEAIQKEIQALGLNAEDLQVKVEGDTVRLTGRAPDPETREKLILAAGNVAGISKVEDSITTTHAAAGGGQEPTFYTVQKGDTLSGIAKKQYGDANAYMGIFQANTPMLKDPDKIYPGQVLRIPPKN